MRFLLLASLFLFAAALQPAEGAQVEKCALKGVRKCVSSANDCQGSVAQGFECENDQICCVLKATTDAPPRKVARAAKPMPQDSDDQGGHKGGKHTAAPKAGTKPSTKPCAQSKKCTKKHGKCQNKSSPCSGTQSMDCKGKNCACCITNSTMTEPSTKMGQRTTSAKANNRKTTKNHSKGPKTTRAKPPAGR
ncbi:uncharacterized protein [Macrobrachium rosenbergii]|uniref:uncharacterized protein n=1 Tax=Macrobrachium rosenbergii TaxID=79674 RepID=UPI0034D674D2